MRKLRFLKKNTRPAPKNKAIYTCLKRDATCAFSSKKKKGYATHAKKQKKTLPSLKCWEPPRQQGLCSQAAHLSATAGFVPRSEALGTPPDGRGYVANVPTCGPLLILSPARHNSIVSAGGTQNVLWGLYASPPPVAVAVVGWFLCSFFFLFLEKGSFSICQKES